MGNLTDMNYDEGTLTIGALIDGNYDHMNDYR